MSPQLKPVQLTPDDILHELVLDSLPDILGNPHKVIAPTLPFEGNHVLALDARQRPAIVGYHARDGGRALLAGLAVLDALADNRAILYRLYPKLFSRNDGGTMFSIDDVRLILLSPAPLPGGSYLARTLPSLTVHTFRTVEIAGEIGLLLDAASPGPGAGRTDADAPKPAPGAAFRRGGTTLSEEEERYFRSV